MPAPKRYRDNAARQKAYRLRLNRARLNEQRAKGMPDAPSIATMPGYRRWNALIEHARAALQTARDEMDDYFEDRTPVWQEGEKGEALQERIQVLEEVLARCEDL